MSRLRALVRRQDGQALVEFSLVGIVFFLLIFSLVDVSRGVWNYNTLSQATREGARYAIVHGADSADPSGPGGAYYSAPSTDTKITDTVEKFGGSLNDSQLTVSSEWLDGTNLEGNRVKVTSKYDYEPIFGIFGILSFTMTSSSTMLVTN